jgi:hypothetical protein
MSKRYDCIWTVDFLPNRTEVAVYDRDNHNVIYQNLAATIDNNFSAVERFIERLGINIFNFEVFDNRLSTVYTGKGSLTEIFSKQSVRDMV